MKAPFATLRWVGEADGHLVLLDQTKLPAETVDVSCRDVETVVEAIRALRVRGAPAIGVAAAYGVCLGLQPVRHDDEAALFARLDEVVDALACSRPTAVNLFWALDRMKRAAVRMRGKLSLDELVAALLAEARAIHEEDRQTCLAIGRHGAELIGQGHSVLTHCNAGRLATSEYGTALAVIFAAHDAGKHVHVYVDETRPLLQGARLTAWELIEHGVETTLICDSAAAHVMGSGKVHAVITGADRIAANGDTANKVGTYGLALSAKAHGIPFYIAAPRSTFDLAIASGEAIPIEERAAEEVTCGFGRRTAPAGVQVYNPAFDVTPAELITAIICERGVIRPVSTESISALLA